MYAFWKEENSQPVDFSSRKIFFTLVIRISGILLSPDITVTWGLDMWGIFHFIHFVFICIFHSLITFIVTAISKEIYILKESVTFKMNIFANIYFVWINDHKVERIKRIERREKRQRQLSNYEGLDQEIEKINRHSYAYMKQELQRFTRLSFHAYEIFSLFGITCVPQSNECVLKPLYDVYNVFFFSFTRMGNGFRCYPSSTIRHSCS